MDGGQGGGGGVGGAGGEGDKIEEESLPGKLSVNRIRNISECLIFCFVILRKFMYFYLRDSTVLEK